MGKPNASTGRARRFRENVAEARRAQAREEILAATRAIVLEGGLSALTMAAVAKRIGVTKPAIYYYFDGRDALVAAVALRALEAEADALVAAVESAVDGLDAAERLVRGCLDHHRRHLDDFRLVYALGQVFPGAPDELPERIPRITSRIYDALEARLVEGQRQGVVAACVAPRRLAVALHLAALGFVAMHSLTDARGQPMKHGFEALIEELLRPLRRGLARAAEAPVPARGGPVA